ARAEQGDRALSGFDEGVHAGLGRMIAELRDIRTGEPADAAPPAPAREDVFLPSIGIGIRERAGLGVVVKSGHNGENHNHNDLGSIAVAVDGVPLLPDLGRATYRSETFSDRRYELWNMRSDWHSTPLPRGAVQLPGAQWRSEVTAVDDGWRVDLTEAHPGGDRWVRTVRVTDAGMSVLDESAALADAATRIVVVCAGVPVRRDDGRVLVAGRHGSRGLLLAFDPAQVEFETVEVDDPYLRHSWGERVTRMLFAPASGLTWEMKGEAS
ncbi:MAG: heparinase II/III family protein, partial [Microbacterium sp.]